MAVKKRKTKDGTIETVLEQELDEATQPELIDTLVEEGAEFLTNPIGEIDLPPSMTPVKHAKQFSGNEINYFLVSAEGADLKTHQSAFAFVNSPTAKDAGLVERFDPDFLRHFSVEISENGVEILLVRAVGATPSLGALPNAQSTLTKPVGMKKISDKANLVMVAENDYGRTMLCAFIGLRDFNIRYETDFSNFASPVEFVTCKARDFLLWDDVTVEGKERD